MIRRRSGAHAAPATGAGTLFAALVAALILTACGKKPEPVAAVEPCQLNLYIWSEYIDPEIVADFEKKFSCKVTIDLYEDNESMVAKLQGGGDSQYDVVVPGNYIIPVMVKLGLLAELRHGNIPNIVNLDDKFTRPAFDPEKLHSVAYQWGTVGIYARKRAQPLPHTWGLIFDAKQKAGTFLMMDSIREMLGSGLRYQGKSVNTRDADELRAVKDLMIGAKKRSQGFEGGVGGKNKVLGKNVDMAVVYNGDAVRGMADDPETEFFVPEEGGVIWVDNLAIPARAPHRDTAEKFINFILDAEIGARLSNYNQYATPNKAARALVKPEDLANTAIYPAADLMAKLEFVDDVGEANKMYDEIWTQIKGE